MYQLLVHILNEDPVLCEVEDLPSPSDQVVTLQNPRRRDGKDLHYLLPNVSTILVPWHRIVYIEMIPTEAEEKVISFVRD